MQGLKMALLVLGVLCSTAVIAVAQGHCVVYYEFDPPVIAFNRAEPVLLRAGVTPGMNGCPAAPQLVLQTSPPITLRDDGTGGDERAGDALFSSSISASVLTTGLQPDDVYRRFVAYLDVLDGGTRTVRLNVFAQIADASLPRYSITQQGADLQHTAYLVNLADPASFPSGGLPDFEYDRIARRFYESFPDSFQFLNVVSIRNHIANRWYLGVRNHIQGTYQSVFDDGAQYGSNKNLLAISVFPMGAYFDGADVGYTHEKGHHWSRHWSASTMAFGIMGMAIAGGEGGSFPCRLVPEGNTVRMVREEGPKEFNDVDLYLMGLMAPDQVPEQIVLVDPPSNLLQQCDGRLWEGDIQRFTVHDVIAQRGPRIPDFTESPRNYRVATIIVSPRLLDDTTMSYFSYFAQRAELTTTVPVHEGFGKYTGKPFALATRGLATLDATVRAADASDFEVKVNDERISVARGGATSVPVYVTPVNGGYDGAVTLTCSDLPARAACVFSPSGVTPGKTGASSTLTLSAGSRSSASNRMAVPFLAFGLAGIVLVGRRRASALALGLALTVATWLGCGRGGGNGPDGGGNPNNGTPPGTYSVTITGTAGGTQRSATVTWTVT